MEKIVADYCGRGGKLYDGSQFAKRKIYLLVDFAFPNGNLLLNNIPADTRVLDIGAQIFN